MSFDLLEKRIEQRGLQVILNADSLNLIDLYSKFKSRGYNLFINPSLEELEKKTKKGEQVVLLLPSLMDGYLEVIGVKRLKAVILTLSKVATSKLKPYVFAEVRGWKAEVF